MLNTSGGFKDLVQSIVGIFNTIMPVLVVLALVLLFIGVVKYIKHEGEHKNREMIMWSLIALFVILSMWGILRLMCNTLVGSTCGNSSGGGGSTTNQQFLL